MFSSSLIGISPLKIPCQIFAQKNQQLIQ